MPLKVTSLSQVSATVSQQTQERLSRLIVEKYPDVDTSRGVIHDIVCFLAGGVIGGILETEVQRVLDSRSLLAITKDPTLADSELVDHILSNFRILRNASSTATGDVRIIVSGDVPISVPAGSVFSTGSINYATQVPYVARPSGTVAISSTDRVLQKRSDGKYEFSVAVACQTSGTVGNIKSGITLSTTANIPGFTLAAAAADFSGGAATETNAELIARMNAGVPARVLAGRSNVVATLANKYVKGSSSFFSVLGFGDTEQTRDQLGLFPISAGSRTDVYVKNSSTPTPATQSVTATLLAKSGTDAVWRVSLPKTTFPGFYRLTAAKRSGSNTLTTWSVTRGYDVTGERYATPKITLPLQSVYSAYQTAVVTLTESSPSDFASLVIGVEKSFDLTAAIVPGLSDLQQFVNHPDNRQFGSDTLIKGAVPCFVSVAVEVVKPVGNADPDTTAIQNAVSRTVNNLGFTASIYATQLAPTITALLSSETVLSKITLRAEILRPDGQIQTLTGTGITIPDLPTALVTPKTTAFFTYSDDVSLTVLSTI